MWWLVTWSTYASWLPGDPRGFQTWRGREYVPPPKRYAKPGEQTYEPAKYKTRYEQALEIAGDPVTFSRKERVCVCRAVVIGVDKLPVTPAVLAIAGQHSHLLAKFGKLDIRPTVGVLKGEATKALREDGYADEEIWSQGCHIKSKREGKEFRIAFRYVRNHEKEGAVVFVWPGFREIR